MNKKLIVGLTLGVLLVAFLIGLVWFRGENSSNNEKIVVGAILPLTGESSSIGKWQQKGIELALKEYNASAPADKQIEIKFEDSQGDPRNGLNAFQNLQFSSSPNAYLISLSGVSNAIIPKLNENPKPAMLLAVSLPNITDKSNSVYRFNLGSEDEALAMSRYMIANQYDSVSVVYLNDEFGVGAINVFKNEFEGKGGKINLTEAYTKEHTDFKSLVAKIKSVDQKGIYVIGYVPASVEFIKQLRQLGYEGQVFANMALSVPSFVKLGGEALNGTIYTVTTFNTNNTDQTIQNFVNAYKTDYSEEPTFFSAFAYDATKILAQNLVAQPTGKINSLNVNNFTGVMGDITMNANRNFQFPIIVVKNENGQIIKIEN